MLEAKKITSEVQIIGYSDAGGIVNVNEQLCFLKANRYRFDGAGGGRENGGYGIEDTAPIGYHLKVPDQNLSARLVEECLAQMEQGEMPKYLTAGVEVEASHFDHKHELLTRYDNGANKVKDAAHPELLSHIVETATGKTRDGVYPRTPVEVALALSAAIVEGYRIADSRGGILTYTSVPEGGKSRDARLTPHPYLIYFSPMVLRDAIKNLDHVPQAVIDLYREIDPNYIKTLIETNTLNWPMQALHVHTGVPQIEGLADPRAAYAIGAVHKTAFAKVASLMLSNTRHIYGVDTGLRDVRSIARRLLATAHDSTVPPNAQLLMNDMVRALTEGEIHSASRYPAKGQHDRVRLRADGSFKTLESIEAPMNPDLRLVLAWTYLNQVMNTIAIDALHNTHGDESRVLECLQGQYGSIFEEIPTMGPGSSYEYDLSFNQSGYAGKPPRSTCNFVQMTEEIGSILTYYGKRFPALRTHTDIVTHVLRQASSQPIHETLERYMGIANGDFNPYGGLSGIVTDYKAGIPVGDLLAIQNVGTNLQAQALANVSDETELLHFFGLI